MLWCGIEACRKMTILSKLLIQKKGRRCNIYAEKTQVPRNDRKTHAKGWFLKKTRIGPVLDTKVCHQEEQYTIEVLVQSLFQERTASWVRIVNGVDKYVTESMLTKKEEDTASGETIAKATPRQKPTVTLTSVSIPVRDRRWIDVETQRSQVFDVSKAMTRFVRHDQSVPREIDGFDGASQWLLEDWNHLW